MWAFTGAQFEERMNEIKSAEAELRIRRKRMDPEKAKALDLAKAKLDWWTTTLENGDATSSLVQLKADGTQERLVGQFVALLPRLENGAAFGDAIRNVPASYLQVLNRLEIELVAYPDTVEVNGLIPIEAISLKDSPSTTETG